MEARELLLPRYKLIAGYPFCELSPGQVITASADGSGFSLGTGKAVTEDDMASYSANFRRLKWWEERDAKDLPAYVKHTVSGKVGKVDKWDLKSAGSGGVTAGTSFWLLQYIMPATEEDIAAR